MAQYRKRKGTDTWHFCANCSNYPTSNFDTHPSTPSSGEKCNECKAKRANGNCT